MTGRRLASDGSRSRWLNLRPASTKMAGRSGYLESEQACGVAAQDRRLLLVGEGGGCKNVVDRMLFPRNWMIGAEHDLAGADLRNEMPQAFRREHHRVEIKLVQIFRGLLLQGDRRVAVLRRHKA